MRLNNCGLEIKSVRCLNTWMLYCHPKVTHCLRLVNFKLDSGIKFNAIHLSVSKRNQRVVVNLECALRWLLSSVVGFKLINFECLKHISYQLVLRRKDQTIDKELDVKKIIDKEYTNMYAESITWRGLLSHYVGICETNDITKYINLGLSNATLCHTPCTLKLEMMGRKYSQPLSIARPISFSTPIYISYFD